MNRPRRERVVLALNSGSSSLKFSVIRVVANTQPVTVLLAGKIEGIGSRRSVLSLKDDTGRPAQIRHGPIRGIDAATTKIQQLLDRSGCPSIDAVGHRIVHGGPRLDEPCLLDTRIMRILSGAVRFDPLHAPPALALIGASRKTYAGIPQIACFDTSFHRTLPEAARTLPLPASFKRSGIRRYGFHGLSCESILGQLPSPSPNRMIIAHLGSGSSITAVRNGHSVDTSMGMTSTGGVLMATRTGDLDPGVLVYLMRHKQLKASAMLTLINHKSGLLGISSASDDLRELHRRAARGDHKSALAIEMFCGSVSKQIAAMIAVLHGIDALVFTGGIGEADAEVRARICAGLEWAGIRLDASKNHKGAGHVADSRSSSQIMVLPAQEEQIMARHCARLLAE